MACLHLPFQAKDMGALYKKVIKGDYKPIPKQYSSELHEVVDKMLIVAAHDRISISKSTIFRISILCLQRSCCNFRKSNGQEVSTV